MSTRFTVEPFEDCICDNRSSHQGSRPRKFEQLIGNSPALEAVLDGASAWLRQAPQF
jgi:hypothetical protein